MLVFGKVRERFGGRVRFFISGAAALNQEIAEWFHAAGILILEGYGLTESSAGSFVNLPDNYRMGRSGWCSPAARCGSATATRSRSRAPASWTATTTSTTRPRTPSPRTAGCAPATRVHIDDDGFLRITGRIKELFKTSGGKYIAPAGDRVEVQGDLPLRQPVRGVRQRAQLRRRPGHPRPRRAGRLGQGERRQRRLRRDRHVRRLREDGAGLRRGAQPAPQPLGDHQEVEAPRPRPLRRVR